MRGYVINVRDVSERKQFEEQLGPTRQFHDPDDAVFGNRALFARAAVHAPSGTTVRDTPVTVLLLDIDDFKSLNDSPADAAGDQPARGGRRARLILDPRRRHGGCASVATSAR